MIQNNYATYFNLGINKEIKAYSGENLKSNLELGVSLQNIFNQSMDTRYYSDYGTLYRKYYFPSTLKFGIANKWEYSTENIKNLAEITNAIEYQDLLNSGYYNAFRYGCEIGIMETLFARFGYYTIDRSTNYYFGNYVKEFNVWTYGFGIKLDFGKYISDKYPFILKFDYVNQKQPNYEDYNSYSETYTNFNVSLNYKL